MSLKQEIQKATSSLIIALSSLMVMNAQDDFFWQEFVKDEATYQSQTIQLPRASYDKPLTLRQQLESVVGQFNYTKGALVQSYMGGIESRVYENVDELLDSDPVMLSFDKGEDQLKRKQFEMNTSIYLYYKDPYGRIVVWLFIQGREDFLTKQSIPAPASCFHLKERPMISEPSHRSQHR